MAKTIFEEMGGTYTQVGDYLLPDLKLPEEEQQPIGVWGQRHRRYLKEHRRAGYATLLTSGKLNGYLADIDRQADELFDTKRTGDYLTDVRRQNELRQRIEEEILSELVYV